MLYGHGDAGHIMADDIKKLLHKNLMYIEEQYEKANKGVSLFLRGKDSRKSFMENVFEKTHIEAVSNNKFDAEKSGATVSLAFLFVTHLLCAHVGVSRVLIR